MRLLPDATGRGRGEARSGPWFPGRRLVLAFSAAAILLAALVGAFLAGGWFEPRPVPSYRQLTFRRGAVEQAFFAPGGETGVPSSHAGSATRSRPRTHLAIGPASETRLRTSAPTAEPAASAIDTAESLHRLRAGTPILRHPRRFSTPPRGRMVARETREIDIARVKPLFEGAFSAVWAGDAASDGFNRLVIGAAMSSREVTVLRAYAAYLRQLPAPLAQNHHA